MKNKNQRQCYISDSSEKQKTAKKNELVKNNDLVHEGQKFIDFQEPIDQPVNHMYNISNSNFYKQFENRDLIEIPEDNINNDLSNNNPGSLFYEKVNSKYFNNLNYPLHKGERQITNIQKIEINIKKEIPKTSQNNPTYIQSNTLGKTYKYEEEIIVNKQSGESSRETLNSLKFVSSQQSQVASSERNNELKNQIPNIYSSSSKMEGSTNKNYIDNSNKSKLISNYLKEKNRNNNQNIPLEYNYNDELKLQTKNSLKRDESNLANDNVINNTNNDLEFLNTLLKLKLPRENEYSTMIKNNNDDSRSYTKEIIDLNNQRETTPNRDGGELFFNENISQISHNKSYSNILNNISTNQGEVTNQRTHGLINSTSSEYICSIKANNAIRNENQINNNFIVNNPTKLNKNDLIEISNKRRNLINSDISSVDGHFRRRHNEAQTRIEKLRKEKIDKENSEIRAQPLINKKSKEIAEKLMNKPRGNEKLLSGMNKDNTSVNDNLTGNNIINNIKYFNYNNDQMNHPNSAHADNEVYNLKQYEEERGKHVNNINVYIGHGDQANTIAENKKRNFSSENLKKSNTNPINFNREKQNNFVIETNRIQIMNEDKKPKIEDYDKYVLLSELVNLGTKSKKNKDIIPNSYTNNLQLVQENKIEFARNYNSLEKEFNFSYDSNRIQKNLNIINDKINNQKVLNHCEIDLFDDINHDLPNTQRTHNQKFNEYQDNYNLKESVNSNIRSSNQLYPVIDKNLEFEIENPGLKDQVFANTQNKFDPNDTNENIILYDKNKTITSKLNYNSNNNFEEQGISSNFSMNFSKYSHPYNLNNVIVPNQNNNINKSLKNASKNYNDITNRNMVNSYISNYNHHENKNNKQQQDKMLVVKKENEIDISLEGHKENDKKNEIINEKIEKNVYAAEIDLFDDREELNIFNDEKNKIKNDINNQVNDKINYFETEHEMHSSINETSMNVNKEKLILNSSNEKKTNIIRENPNQNKDDENYTIENKSLYNKPFKNSSDMIIPNYLNKLILDKIQKNVNNTTDTNNKSCLLKNSSTLKPIDNRGDQDQSSKSINKLIQRTSSVENFSHKIRSDSLSREQSNPSRNLDKNSPVLEEKSNKSIHKTSAITEKQPNFQKGIKNNIKKGMKNKTNVDTKIKNNLKNLKEKTMKIGQNMTNRTTNSKINKDSNTNQNMPSKSRVKVFANINNTVALNTNVKEINPRVILEEDNLEISMNEEEILQIENLKNESPSNNELEVKNNNNIDEVTPKYNFINLESTKNNPVIQKKNNATSIKYDYNDMLKIHKLRQKQSIAEIENRVNCIIMSQEQCENNLKQDFKNMNIDESSILRDSTLKFDAQDNSKI